jgi:hypothetical protein
MVDHKDDMIKTVKKTAISDMDALDTFPLSIIPLSSNSLRSAKLIKNARMETTVELHNDPISGSYQILPEAIAETFKGAESDQEIITKLSLLNSYDVFSLRNSIAKLGLELNDPTALTLSGDMRAILNTYAVQFSRPLMTRIFGAEANVPQSDMQQLLRDPDVAKVRQNLMIMTQKTGIPLGDIPRFIEDYNDVYLSLAYYRHCFESIGEQVQRFMAWMDELKRHRDVISTPQTLSSCKKTEDALRFLTLSIRERLARLQYSFEIFWKNINPDSFMQLRQQIEDNHASLGAVLCGLLVKMRLWEKAFPDNRLGGPVTRAKFVVTELEPGLERLRSLENIARMRLGLLPLK